MECVPNPHPGTHYVTRYTYPQSTCVCPVTGQLNFAHLVINYISGQWLVESKSLKFYL
jgi:7-cyano-7-deazaguanine reductase